MIYNPDLKVGVNQLTRHSWALAQNTMTSERPIVLG